MAPLEVEETERELPTMSREVDFAARVSADGQEALMLIEFQTHWEADVPRRMVSYTWRLVERHKLAVYPIVVVLLPGGQIQSEWRMQAFGKEIDWFRFKVIPLWEMDARKMIDQKLVGVYPLLPLMHWDGDSDARIVETSERLVQEEARTREERADCAGALEVLCGIRFPTDLVRRLLRRSEMRLESPVYQEWMEEGRVAGLQEGRVAGLEEGKELGIEEGLQESVLEALEVRFDSVPAEVERKVRRIKTRKTLERLHRLSIVTESIDAFQESLSEFQA